MMKHDNSNQNPWAGLSSYEDPAKSELKLKFCGRDNETKEVARLIDDNFFVTLYGKSGIGKTSLLNAGVFPALRREQYTPLSLRLGMTEETISFQDVITQEIEHAIDEIGGSVHVVNVMDEQAEQDATDYLWHWFARRRFLTADGQITFPVLVFDQFEEVFRHKESRRKTKILLEQLNYLIDESHGIGDCVVDGEAYNYDFNFRFVLSIREDDLYRLEDALDNCSLPALKHCRYRLRCLSEEGAHKAILIPGEGLFKKEEKDQIVQTIIQISRNKDDKSISSNLLSLVCNRLYVESLKGSSSTINLSLVDSFVKSNPFERFYNEATCDFSNKEKSYIEDNFVDSTGRRNSIPESDFLMHVHDGIKLIEGKNRILQRTSTSSDGQNYRIELLHDSFCEILVKQNMEREKKKSYRWNTYVKMLLFFSILLLAVTCDKNWYFDTQKGSLIQDGLTGETSSFSWKGCLISTDGNKCQIIKHPLNNKTIYLPTLVDTTVIFGKNVQDVYVLSPSAIPYFRFVHHDSISPILHVPYKYYKNYNDSSVRINSSNFYISEMGPYETMYYNTIYTSICYFHSLIHGKSIMWSILLLVSMIVLSIGLISYLSKKYMSKIDYLISLIFLGGLLIFMWAFELLECQYDIEKVSLLRPLCWTLISIVIIYLTNLVIKYTIAVFLQTYTKILLALGCSTWVMVFIAIYEELLISNIILFSTDTKFATWMVLLPLLFVFVYSTYIIIEAIVITTFVGIDDYYKHKMQVSSAFIKYFWHIILIYLVYEICYIFLSILLSHIGGFDEMKLIPIIASMLSVFVTFVVNKKKTKLIFYEIKNNLFGLIKQNRKR